VAGNPGIANTMKAIGGQSLMTLSNAYNVASQQKMLGSSIYFEIKLLFGFKKPLIA
jgi:hypothetical protein